MAYQQVFDKRQRNAGTYDGDLAISPTSQVNARMLMDVADQLDTTLTITMHSQKSTDGGATWSTLARGTWVGGTQPDDGSPKGVPAMTYSGNQAGVNAVRSTVTINKRISWGAEVEVI